MSDSHLRLLPTDPTWRPRPEAAERAVTTLEALIPEADHVEMKLYDEIRFIDPGANFERLSCPACRTELAMDWWSERMEQASAGSFRDRDVTTPCCGIRTSLDDLLYDWPAGFARAELSVLNPGRSSLDEAELARVADALGQQLAQVMAHY